MYIKRQKIHTILEALKVGNSFRNACKMAGIDASTFWLWRKKNKRLNSIVLAIVDSRIQFVEDAVFKAACEGNTTAMIFFLTNRAPDRWADRRALVNNTNVFAAGQNSEQAFLKQLPDKDLNDLCDGLIQRRQAQIAKS